MSFRGKRKVECVNGHVEVLDVASDDGGWTEGMCFTLKDIAESKVEEVWFWWCPVCGAKARRFTTKSIFEEGWNNPWEVVAEDENTALRAMAAAWLEAGGGVPTKEETDRHLLLLQTEMDRLDWEEWAMDQGMEIYGDGVQYPGLGKWR